MNKKLRPFQEIGAAFLAARNYALLADEPGLGKTIQAIDAARRVGAKRVLVICPASVRLGWEQELRECLGSSWGWRIMSYNEAVKFSKTPGPDSFDLCVLDEAHFLKTLDSQRTKAVFGNGSGMARRARRVWALTGTPVLNRPVEMYPILKVLASECIKPHDNFGAYTNRWCGAYFDGRGLNVRGATNLDELAERIKPFMLRRTKAEVLTELPPKIIQRVPLEVTQAEIAALMRAEEEIANRETLISSAREDFSQLGDISTLLRLTGESKVAAASRYIDDLLDTEQKIVVFARHRAVIAALSQNLSGRGHGAVVYQGGMSDFEKRAAVDAFVKDANTRVFIGNITAAGTGINGLQSVAQTAVFAELSWTPGEMDQACDRLHRMGQTGGVVNVHLLHIPGSLEASILGVHVAKNSVISRLMRSGDRDAGRGTTTANFFSAVVEDFNDDWEYL